MKRTLTYTADRGCNLTVGHLRKVVDDLNALNMRDWYGISASTRPGPASGANPLRQLKVEGAR